MSKRSRFRPCFGSQRVNGSQSLLKSARHHFYTFFLLILGKLCCKKFLLVRFEILALFLNTITSDGKISCRVRDDLAQQFQMQLSQEPTSFSLSFFAFPKSTSNLANFQTEEGSYSLSVSEIIDSQRSVHLNV